MPNYRSRILIFIAFTFLIASVSFAQSQNAKVAVIVSGGDMGSLEESLQALEKQATETYERLGFKVIVVGGVNKAGLPLTAESLKKTLGELKDVKDLRLDFLGHGGVAKVPNAYPATAVPFSKAREKNSFAASELAKDGKLVWFAGNYLSADQRYYGEKANALGGAVTTVKPIHQDNVAESLAEFHKKNPDGIATVNLLNCFSGSVAQRLRTDEKTIVFANSPHNTVALSLIDRVSDDGKTVREMGVTGNAFLGSQSGLGRYYELLSGSYKLENGEKSEASLGFSRIRNSANARFANLLSTDPTNVTNVGRSPEFESVIGWCEAGRPGALKHDSLSGKDDEKKSPARSKVIAWLAVEKAELRRRFDFAERIPSSDDPKKTLVSSLKAEFDSCRSDRKSYAKKRSAEEAKRARELAQLIEIYKDDPKKPFRQLLAAYERNLGDPTNYPEIVARFKDSIENDLNNLRQTKTPEDRWGGLRDVIDGIKSKKITEAWILEKIRSQMNEWKKACVEGDPFRAPCYPDLVHSNRDLGSYLLGMRDKGNKIQTTDEKCASPVDTFGCVQKRDPQSMMLAPTIEKYWLGRGFAQMPAEKDLSDMCEDQGWVRYSRAKNNVALDEKCVADFQKHAPESEWVNLERLSALGERNARGETGATVSKTTDQKPVVK